MAEKRKHQGRTVKKEIEIDATPEEVYEAWADPDRIAQWFVDRAEGRAETGAIVQWIFDHFGQSPIPILEAEPGERIVIGGEIPGRPPFLQEILLEHRGGKTVLRLLNSGFGDGAEWDEEYRGIDSGWSMALATLKHWLERYPDGRRNHVMVLRAVDTELQAFVPHLTSLEAVGEWFGQGLGPGSEVLCRTDREMLVAWPERNAVLGFKVFTRGGRTVVGLDLSAWNGAGKDPEPVLEAALDRLVKRATD